jgi:hypothetical protein
MIKSSKLFFGKTVKCFVTVRAQSHSNKSGKNQMYQTKHYAKTLKREVN